MNLFKSKIKQSLINNNNILKLFKKNQKRSSDLGFFFQDRVHSYFKFQGPVLVVWSSPDHLTSLTSLLHTSLHKL